MKGGSPGDELVEIVDPQGRVLRTVTRAEMRRDNLRHRSTYVVVMNGQGEVVVHRRADWKDVLPGFWDLCFGGVAGVGEDWVSAAKRELAEEAGLGIAGGSAIELVDLGPLDYEDDIMSVYGRVFLAHSDETPTCPDGEVVELDLVPVNSLGEWAQDRDVCPDSLLGVVPRLIGHLGQI